MSDKRFMNRFDGERDFENSETHISSFIIHCKPTSFPDVAEELKRTMLLDVYAEDSAGKFVVVVEANNSKRILDIVSVIEKIPGVFNTAMVYHQTIFEDEERKVSRDRNEHDFDEKIVMKNGENAELNQSVH